MIAFGSRGTQSAAPARMSFKSATVRYLTKLCSAAALVTAQAGPAVTSAMPNTNATVYSSATCSTVPKTAQGVPDMTDFLAGLQVLFMPSSPCCISADASLVRSDAKRLRGGIGQPASVCQSWLASACA